MDRSEISCEVVVLGLGAYGAGTLRVLAEAGIDTIGVDRFSPPHAFGSSHGSSRITRVAVGEGDTLVPLVQRSHTIWRELEAKTGRQLLVQNGALLVGRADGGGIHHGRVDFVRRSIEIARRFGIEHEVLDARGVQARFPQFALHGDELAYFEPGGGFVRPEECIAAQLEVAGRAGARIRTNEQILRIDATDEHVTVVTDRATIVARKAVSCLGAWTGATIGEPWTSTLSVHGQTLFWFAPSVKADYEPSAFPVFIWMHGDDASDYFYGFPELDGESGVKVATEQYEAISDPDRPDAPASAADANAMFERHVRGRLDGLTAACEKTMNCYYTATVDSRFRIDRHPGTSNLIVVSACSGHGFKHSAGCAAYVAEWAATGTKPDVLEPFALTADVAS